MKRSRFEVIDPKESRVLSKALIWDRVVGKQHRGVSVTAGQKMWLEQEPTNSFDSFAVKVMTGENCHVGYVPRPVNIIYFQLLHTHDLKGVFCDREDHTFESDFCVFIENIAESEVKDLFVLEAPPEEERRLLTTTRQFSKRRISKIRYNQEVHLQKDGSMVDGESNLIGKLSSPILFDCVRARVCRSVGKTAPYFVQIFFFAPENQEDETTRPIHFSASPFGEERNPL